MCVAYYYVLFTDIVFNIYFIFSITIASNCIYTYSYLNANVFTLIPRAGVDRENK